MVIHVKWFSTVFKVIIITITKRNTQLSRFKEMRLYCLVFNTHTHTTITYSKERKRKVINPTADYLEVGSRIILYLNNTSLSSRLLKIFYKSC